MSEGFKIFVCFLIFGTVITGLCVTASIFAPDNKCAKTETVITK